MNPAGLAWLWFALSIGCVLAGLALTGKRAASAPPEHHAPGANKETRCASCALPLEPDARFCGACGMYRYQKHKPGARTR